MGHLRTGAGKLGSQVGASLLLLGAALPASAQEAPASHAAAIASFEEGTRLVTQGDCAGAVVKFKQSLTIEAGVGAQLDLADCEERLGATEAAWRDFRRAEHLAEARKDERAQVARLRATQLAHQLVLVAVPYTPGLRLVVDGRVVDPDLLEEGWVAVAPGGHRIEASAAGRDPVVLTVPSEAEPGRTFTLPPLAAAAPTPVPLPPSPVRSTPPQGASQRTLGLALGGLGLLGVATGAVTGVLTFVSQHNAAAACGATYPRCDLSTQSAVTSANNQAGATGAVSNASFVVGGLGLAGGALLFFTAPHGENAPREALRLAPMFGAAGTGATLVGRW